MTDDLRDLTVAITALAIRAGAIALAMRDDATRDARQKSDGTPVTTADETAESVINEDLAARFPDIPIVGEESVAAGNMPDISGGRFWLVDPIDGTKDYIGGGPEFTVNIGLIDNWVPVAGVVNAPALGQTYAGSVGNGATRRDADGSVHTIGVSGKQENDLRVVASRRHDKQAEVEALLAGRSVSEWVSISSSLKFCLIAGDQADLYPRIGPTHEWDTAAGDAVVRAAGGSVITMQGDTLRYGKLPRLLNEGFIARAHP